MTFEGLFVSVNENPEEEMLIGVLKETSRGECRVALSPESVKKLVKKSCRIIVESGAGDAASFPGEAYEAAGAKVVSRSEAAQAKIVLKVAPPAEAEVGLLARGSIFIGFLEPFRKDGPVSWLARQQVDSISMEWIPRTSRAQSMDALSSQANLAGYRAVLEAAGRFNRFFPSMMTSAGMAKPARVIVLGAGVAGLQAIATARRLGAHVEAFDVRAEVKEQILSLGAKFIEINVGEEGSGAGGYAKELSEEGKRKQQEALGEKLMTADIVISTANIPGRKAPVLITETAVNGMKPGSVIIDMAAINGGNCPLTKMDEVIQVGGVTIVGTTNYPSLMAGDASRFYGQNIVNLLDLILKNDNGTMSAVLNLEDDIIKGSLATFQGNVQTR